MSENDLTPSDFERMQEGVQTVFEGLAQKVHARLPSLNAKLGRTATRKFPLYSYVTFEEKSRSDIDPVVVGVDVRVDTGVILIQAHIMSEETGQAHFDLPKRELPFGTDRSEVLTRVVNAAEQLADNTLAVLERVFEYAKPLRAPA